MWCGAVWNYQKITALNMFSADLVFDFIVWLVEALTRVCTLAREI